MKGKKQPLTFAEPAEAPLAETPLAEPVFAEAPPMPPLPPLDADEELTLAMPQSPGEAESEIRLARFDPPSGAVTRAAPARQGRGIYWLAGLASALWAGGMVGVVFAYQHRLGFFDYDPLALSVFALLALAPIGLIWLSIHALRQGAAFVSEARLSKDYAERMLEPAALSAAEAGSVVEALRLQIDRATGAASDAYVELGQWRERLTEETERLVQVAAVSTQTAQALVEGLARERQELVALSGSLDGQAQAIAEAITRQARMVADASDLAQTQIGEAEAALAARAADLTAAGVEAASSARIAGEDLARQTARLEAAGATVGDQVQIVEDTLAQQRAALAAAAHDLRADQEDLAVQVETQRAQLADILSRAGDSAAQLGEVTAEGAEHLRLLTAEAADQYREVAETAQAERDLLGATALQSLGAFSEAAAFERRALEEQTRRAIDALQAASEEVHRNAESSGEAARLKVEQLSEAAFAAGQKADAVFETRMSEARDLIERTAQLVQDAGDRSAARLDSSVDAARTALSDLERSLAAIEERSARLPEQAQARAAEIAAALDQANQGLLASARQAAAETQAIDAAFQERIKRNYEMLSEAVRLMGVIGGGASARASGQGMRPPQPRSPPADPGPLRSAPSEGARPRLKLKPTAGEDGGDDAIFAHAPAPSAPQPASHEGDEWTWRDLLGAVDEGDAGDEASLAEVLIGEIEALGLDSAGLLPRSRIDEVLKALDAGNPAAARDSVRRLAPAAIRRLSRRVLSDKVLRAQAERFISSFHSLLREARRPDSEVHPATLLGDNSGRAYLLLDAAVGDLH